VSQVLLGGFGAHLRDMCPRKGAKQNLEDFVRIADQQVVALVQETICRAPVVWLNRAEEHFMSNLDFFKPVRVRAGFMFRVICSV